MGQAGELVRLEARGLDWIVVGNFREVVSKDARVASPGGAELVKSGPARRVWRFQAGLAGVPTEVFVKEYLLADVRDRVKYAFQPSKAWREWTAALELARRDIPAPQAVAVGVRRQGMVLSRSILITKSIADVVPLERYVLDRLDAAGHEAVTVFSRAFAQFLRKVHDAGVFHRDFHQQNILVGGPPESPRFYLVDLHDVRIGAPLRRGDRLENLAVLGRFFCQVAPKHWRRRFLDSYFRDRHESRQSAARIEEMAERGTRRVWAKRDRRVYGNNKYFRPVQVAGLAGRARKTPAAQALAPLFTEADPFGRAEAVLKDTRTSKVGMFRVETRHGAARVLIKRRNPRRGFKAVLDPFRMSRAMRGFFYGAAFENRDIPTPRVLAAYDCRRLGCLDASYLVLEYVDGAENLGDCIAEGQGSSIFQSINADRACFLARLAKILRRMHWSGLSMRDLKAANILLCAGGRGDVGIMISDLDGARLYPIGVPEKRAIQNLARLYFDVSYLGAVTRREAMKFLRTYLGPVDRKTLCRWVSGIAEYVSHKRVTFKPKGIFAAGRKA